MDTVSRFVYAIDCYRSVVARPFALGEMSNASLYATKCQLIYMHIQHTRHSLYSPNERCKYMSLDRDTNVKLAFIYSSIDNDEWESNRLSPISRKRLIQYIISFKYSDEKPTWIWIKIYLSMVRIDHCACGRTRFSWWLSPTELHIMDQAFRAPTEYDTRTK